MQLTKILIITFLLTIGLFFNNLDTFAQRKNFTVAFVNSRAVMAEMAEWKMAEAQIKAYADSMNAVLAEKVGELAADYKKLERQMPILSGNAGKKYLAEQNEKLREKKKELEKMKDAIPKAIEERVTKLTESLENKISDAILAVSEAEKFDFVYDIADNDCFYISTVAYDLTDAVIEDVNGK